MLWLSYINLAGKRNLLVKFIGLNDCNDNIISLKRAINIIDKDVKRYYESKEIKFKSSQNIKEIENSQNTDVIVPLNYYVSKFQLNYIPKISTIGFRNAQMKRIHNNFDIIERLFIEDNKSFEDVAKWLRINIKVFEKCLDAYFRILNKRSKHMQEEYHYKLERMRV